MYCIKGEFHSDPVCTEPVQNFPIKSACNGFGPDGNSENNEESVSCSCTLGHFGVALSEPRHLGPVQRSPVTTLALGSFFVGSNLS